MYRLILLVVLLLLAGPAQAIDTDDRLLVWVADGVRPGELFDRSDRGVIAYMDGDGEIVQELIDVPANTVYLTACTERATSPDGEHFAFFIGDNTNGSLYIISGQAEPVEILNINPRACLGLGTFRWLEDGARFAYVDYDEGQGITNGTFNIHQTTDPETVVFTYENVAAFDYTFDALTLVEVFPDYVEVLHGPVDDLIETTRIYTEEENCPFQSGAVTAVRPGTVGVLLGQNCTGRNTFDLYTVDAGLLSANRVLAGATGRNQDGRPVFTDQSAATGVFSATGDAGLYLMYPDGLLGNFSASLAYVDLTQVGTLDGLYDFVVTPRQPSRTLSASPVVSPDEAYLAIIRQTADVDSALLIFNLQTEAEILRVSGGNLGNTVSTMAFNQAGDTLYYVTGGTDGASNLLFALNPATGETEELARGNFYAPLVIAPDGGEALLMNQATAGASDDPYLNLDVIDLTSGEITTVAEGATIAEGEIETQRFIYPLSWRG
jgi:hypothetical protein